MLLLDEIAERALEAAARAGAFDNLPGAGKPLALDDDRLVPEHLRAAYRILRNAGFVPPEVEARRELADLNRLIATTSDDRERHRAGLRLALIEAALEARGRRPFQREGEYRSRMTARLDRSR